MARPLGASLALLAACALAHGAAVEPIPTLDAPLSGPPVVAQLRLDLAALSVPASLALPPAAVAASPAGWANLQALMAAPTPAAASAAPEAAPTGAVRRLKVAQEILGAYEPGQFAKLSDAGKDAALGALWDGWKREGLVQEPAGREDAGRAMDALILEGVDDKALTAANKSVFLGVGVLGYPLREALWLQRTRISDALDENSLRYPSGQRWLNESGTPEFLGTSGQAQALVDRWGEATEYARQLARQAAAGSKDLPRGTAASAEAAAAFARVAAELASAGDTEAVEYLTGRDPTFTAFLLDADKPGYYLYNGDHSAVARILATRAAQDLGLRRVEHRHETNLAGAVYIYRPARVVERLRAAAAEDAGPDSADAKRRLAAYAERLAPLAARVPAARPAAGFRFVDPELLPGSALDSAENRYDKRTDGGFSRYDLPFPLGMIRARVAKGDPYGQFDEKRWRALAELVTKCPALAGASDQATLRFVSEPHQTRGRLIASLDDPEKSGVVLQMALLDRLASSRGAAHERDLAFAAAALQAALRR